MCVWCWVCSDWSAGCRSSGGAQDSGCVCGAGYVVIGVLVAGPLVGHRIVGVCVVLGM